MGEMAYEASQYLNPVTAPFKFAEDIVKLKANYDSLKNITDDEIETYSALMGDADTYSLFMDFSKDYVKAQHSLEITEAGGMAAFEIAVIVITAGVGAAASVRHLGKLGKLKPLMGDLVKLLKRKRAKKSVSGDNNKTLESKNELKVDKSVDINPEKKVGGRKIINSDFSGKTIKTKGGDVYFDNDGFPDFNSYSQKTVRVEGLTGDMANDIPLAMDKSGLSSYDKKNYVWHHHQDGKTMQLVPRNVHSVRNGGVAHTGGRAVIQHNLTNLDNQLSYPSPAEK